MYKIGVLDDDENWCLIVERFLRKDFEVHSYKTVFTFLQEIEDYDLLIIDFSLPPALYEKGMDGCEIINHIKNNFINPPLLVLATGFISANDLEYGRGICPEADAFLAKDAGLDIILNEVKRLLEPKERDASNRAIANPPS
jgi:CheY-like chemotaxis protein